MSYLNWDSNLACGVSEIDNQHKALFEMFNRMYTSLLAGENGNFQEELINDMFLYAASHFSTEERYMIRYQYPDIDAHLSEHEDFTNVVQNFRCEYDGGKALLTVEILDFLKEWILKHVCSTDQKMGEFLQRKMQGTLGFSAAYLQ